MTLQVRIFRLDGVEELREPAVILAGAIIVFVAHLDVIQDERRRMSVLRALRAPPGVCRSSHVLDFIQRILHVRLKFRPQSKMLSTQRITGIDGQHRLHVQIFAPFQKFQQPKTVGGPITPRAFVAGPVFNWTSGFLPIKSLVNVVTFQVIAAGEP